MCRGEARRRDVTIEFKCAQAPLLSTVDIIQIKQVLICLILNSVEALRESTPADRRITVVTNQSADEWVTIDVEDNERGVPPELSDKVFEAFFTTKSEGMGMGLAISRSIVENHGGRIDHRTGANGGAVFCVSLPAYIEHRP